MYSTRPHQTLTNTPRAHTLTVTVTHSPHTHHSITTSLLNDHGFTIDSPYTPPSPLSLPTHTHTRARTHTHTHTHTLQTHLLLNTLTIHSLTTCIHITRHYRQWSPHSLTYHSITYRTLTHSTNKRELNKHSRRTHHTLRLPPFTHTLTIHSCMHSTRTHHALTNPPHTHEPTTHSHNTTHSLYTITRTTHSPHDYLITTHSSLMYPHSLTSQSRTHYGAPTLSHTPHAIIHRSRTQT